MTLREAGRRLNLTPDRVHGMADALAIALSPVGRALVMSEGEFQLLKRAADKARSRKPTAAAR